MYNRVKPPIDLDRIATSVEPDQTAPFEKYFSENLLKGFEFDFNVSCQTVT